MAFLPLLTLGQLQQQEFALYSNDHQIGQMLVSSKEGQIEIKSEVSLKFLAKATVRYTLISNFGPTGLTKSTVTTFLNERLHSSTEINANASGYELVKDGKKRGITGQKTYTGAMLYVMEPWDITHVFSEADGLMRRVEKVANHHYRLIHPKKKNQVQEFKYKDGALVEATVQHPFKTFHIKKTNGPRP